MPLDRSDIEASLKKKGFVEVDGSHRFYTLMVDGRKSGITTMTSKGTKYKTLGDPLVAAMARELKLNKKQFIQFVDCKISGEEYLVLVRDEL